MPNPPTVLIGVEDSEDPEDQRPSIISAEQLEEILQSLEKRPQRSHVAWARAIALLQDLQAQPDKGTHIHVLNCLKDAVNEVHDDWNRVAEPGRVIKARPSAISTIPKVISWLPQAICRLAGIPASPAANIYEWEITLDDLLFDKDLNMHTRVVSIVRVQDIAIDLYWDNKDHSPAISARGMQLLELLKQVKIDFFDGEGGDCPYAFARPHIQDLEELLEKPADEYQLDVSWATPGAVSSD
ncbi:hypothetical protein PT974_09626 [Cladobotryum mycophilum]|uniref:Uncharacterized protein n=1 Tax=Cladobotryum mycophilum TaxID=491253 RepID=A0ABR0SGT4_9HYPO